MTITATDNGYLVDLIPCETKGTGCKKEFKSKKDANAYEAWLNEKDLIENDTRPLTVLIDLWFEHKGIHLLSGIQEHGSLLRIYKALGKPKVCQITTSLLIDYRDSQLDKGKKINTLNRECRRLSCVFSSLISMGLIKGKNPLDGLSSLKEQDLKVTYLRSETIRILLNRLDGDALKIAKICLSTGATWGEAQRLKGIDINNNLIRFYDSNNKARTVTITDALLTEISPNTKGKLFSPSFYAFRKVITELRVSSLTAHLELILRQTFAAHYVINGGNILTLRKILGHSTIKETLAYSHLTPDDLANVTTLNPLTTLDL